MIPTSDQDDLLSSFSCLSGNKAESVSGRQSTEYDIAPIFPEGWRATGISYSKCTAGLPTRLPTRYELG